MPRQFISEDALEQYAISWFKEIGWEYRYGPDIAPDGAAPERASYDEMILAGRLRAAMERLNPGLPAAVIDEALHVVTSSSDPSLVRANHALYTLITRGVAVESAHGAERKPEQIDLIDFADPLANDFLVVNQFVINGAKQIRRPDMVVFVNGLPLAVIELKSPLGDAEKTGVEAAYQQLVTYRTEAPELFHANLAMVASDGFGAVVGALTASFEWYLPWRAVRDEDDRPTVERELETVVRGLFRRDYLIEYLRGYVLFERDGDALIKKIAGYHQFHGVREAARATAIAAGGRAVGERRATYLQDVVPGSRKAGVFWHTQGSGKSISMCFYAAQLARDPDMNNPTIVVVTDRNDLDGQLHEQFSRAVDLLGQRPEQATSREELRELLGKRAAGGIIFTTVQKFSLVGAEPDHPALCERTNVVVIVDEAHRTQYGLRAKLDQEKGTYRFGYAKHMRDALPNASFIAFTGTPIAQVDRDTRGLFGEYVSIYDMQDAVNDGATVPIYYESRLAKLDINREEIEALNEEVEEVIEDEEDVAERERTKGRWAELAKLVGARERLKEVARDMVAHFETRTEALDGKGMIVCMSREICVALFDEITALRPEWAGDMIRKDGVDVAYDPESGAIRIVMTGGASDREELQRHIYSSSQKKRLEKRFKDPDDPLRLVIVRDMWLTGFDAPVCHTMYVDKPMQGHNVMQAIARVNRVFKDKPGGLVVDYLGIVGSLKEALKDYTDANGKGEPTVDDERALDMLLEKMSNVRGLMYGCDYSDFEDDPLRTLGDAVAHITGLRNGKERFYDMMASVSKAYALCSTLDEARALRTEIAFFGAVRNLIEKGVVTAGRRKEEERNSALKQILDNAIIAQGTLDLFALAGVERPDIGILSDAFLDELRNAKRPNLAVDLLERLIRDQIRGRAKSNVVQEKKYGERLQESLNRYHNRAIETTEVIEELIAMAREMRESFRRDEELGLNADEIAFYDALAENESAVRELGDATLKALAVELTRRLRSSTTVDWQVRDSVRARMRILVRRLLKRYKYPPDAEARAIDLVLEQAEVMADVWTAG